MNKNVKELENSISLSEYQRIVQLLLVFLLLLSSNQVYGQESGNPEQILVTIGLRVIAGEAANSTATENCEHGTDTTTDFENQLAITQTFPSCTVIFGPTDGSARIIYAVSQTVNHPTHFDSLQAGYLAATDGGMSEMKLNIHASPQDPNAQRADFTALTTNVGTKDDPQYLLQVTQGKNSIETVSNQPTGTVTLTDTTALQSFTYDGIADDSLVFRNQQSTESGRTQIAIFLDGFLPASVLGKNVKISLSHIDVTAKTVTGTVEVIETGELYTFSGANTDGNGFLEGDELTLELVINGVSLFLPMVAR